MNLDDELNLIYRFCNMKIKIMLLCAFAGCLGYLLGHFTREKEIEKSISESNISKSKLNHSDHPRLKMEPIADSGAGVKKGADKVDKEEVIEDIKIRRKYGILMDKLIERNESLSWMRVSDNFEVGDDVLSFFDLDNEKKDDFKKMCEKYRSLIKNTELKSGAVLVSSGDDMIYKIPGNPELADKMRSEFRQDLYSALGGEGLTFLDASVNQIFDDLKYSRRIKYSISDENKNVWEYKYRVESLDDSGNVKSSSGSNRLVKKDGSNGPPPSIPGRYDHLFSIK